VSAIEKEVLFRAVGHPFLVQLLTYFQTKESLWYVMEYVEGGTLRSFLSRRKRFNEDEARFYLAEIILAVNFLHKCGIVHRDIKPENVLLDRNGHCKLADFGLCKVGMFAWSKTSGVCGTKQYMAPEMRRGDRYGPEVDWWSVGCIAYEMMLGKRRYSYVTVHCERFPTYVTRGAECILKKFLRPDPRRRLGARGDTRSILRHHFFKKVDWEALLEKCVTPPLKPPTLNFLKFETDAPGDGDDIRRNPSIENSHHEAILEAPLNPDDQLVLEATFNREAPIVLEAPVDQDTPLVPQELVDSKEIDQSLEEEHEEESVEETLREIVEDRMEKEESFQLKDEEESVEETLREIVEDITKKEEIFQVTDEEDSVEQTLRELVEDRTEKEELLQLKDEEESVEETLREIVEDRTEKEELLQLKDEEESVEETLQELVEDVKEEEKLFEQTDEEESEENPPHFSLWRKMKIVIGGVLVGLVAFALAMIEISFTETTEQTD